MDWFDRDDFFEDDDGGYDDAWFKPCVDQWRSIHPLGHNPYEYDQPWGIWDSNYDEDP